MGDYRALAIVDRVIRTIRRWLDILFETSGNFDWLTYIDDMVDAYNMRHHRTIQARPIDVFKGVNKNKQRIQRGHLIDEFEKGDKVRKELKRNLFSKGGKQYSKQIFTVRKELKRNLFSKGGKQYSKQIFTVVGRKGFKLILNSDELVSPRELLKTKLDKPADEEKQINEQVKDLIKQKKRKELLNREDIQPENIRTSKRARKAKLILDL